MRRKDPLSSLEFVDKVNDEGREHLMYAGSSIPTKELSTGTESSLSKIVATHKYGTYKLFVLKRI